MGMMYALLWILVVIVALGAVVKLFWPTHYIDIDRTVHGTVLDGAISAAWAAFLIYIALNWGPLE